MQSFPMQTVVDAASLDDILAKLYTLRRFHATTGLHRIQALCEALGEPQTQFPSIHIAGTNGKGTVSSLLASVLMEAGYRVGLYTSPHISRFNERIRVQGREILDDNLLRLCRSVMPLVIQQSATFFEAATALAFRYFADETVDIAIIETGLGGRLDATNILCAEHVLATAVTSIDYDHTEYLGDTLELIAGEKAGIMKHGVPCVVNEQRPMLVNVFKEFALQTASPLVFLHDISSVQIKTFSQDLSMTLNLEMPGQTLLGVRSPLCGEHQANNVATTHAVLQQVQPRFPTSEQHFRAGLTRVRENSGLRGRIELLRQTPPVVLDVAHNPAGLRRLADTLRLCGYETAHSWNIIFAAMQDKDVSAMLEQLAPLAKAFYAPALHVARASNSDVVVQEAAKYGVSVRTFDSVALACKAAVRDVDVNVNATPTLVAGSFHLAEEVLAWWQSL
jgi:dihydrofolate synthase / folylpolyglutamate synthase